LTDNQIVNKTQMIVLSKLI